MIKIKIVLICCLFLFACNSEKFPTIAGNTTSTPLPLKSNKWKTLDLDEGHNSDTYILELSHGWLVYRSSGFGGGMAFVPKPAEIK
ncbi:MAG: hypothetical protein LBC94_03425 [Desulfovibrio sp.]|jgi:hypothetical protein|nr:hypothetical protein [Desulfovibrio sp.]